MPILIAVIVGLDILFFAAAVYLVLEDKRRHRKERLLRGLAPGDALTGNGAIRHKTGSTEGRLTVILGRFVDLSALDALFAAADVPMSVERMLFVALGIGFLFLIPVGLVLPHPLLMVFCMAAGIAMPFVYLVWRRRKREEALVKQLPEALEMIVRALRVGQSVDGALKEVGRNFPPPIGIEIRSIYDEMVMGLPFEQALGNFTRRFPRVADIKIFCAAFAVQRETGGNLTRILQGLASTIRERFTFKRQVRTLTAEGRTSARILAILPLAFGGIIWLLNADYIRTLFIHPAGRKMLLYAAVSVLLGFIVMRMMTRIDM